METRHLWGPDIYLKKKKNPVSLSGIPSTTKEQPTQMK